MRPALIALAALGALAAAACASQQWAKKGASAEQVQTDLRECEDAALREANAVPQPYPTMGPAIMQPPSENRIGAGSDRGSFADPHGERFMRQERLARECMNKKGYVRVPAQATQN